MHAEALVNRINNEKHYLDAVTYAVQAIRRAVDSCAVLQAKDNAEWHDDPDADDHAEHHASADEQFPRETRDQAAKELVAYYLQELVYQD